MYLQKREHPLEQKRLSSDVTPDLQKVRKSISERNVTHSLSVTKRCSKLQLKQSRRYFCFKKHLLFLLISSTILNFHTNLHSLFLIFLYLIKDSLCLSLSFSLSLCRISSKLFQWLEA